MAINPDKYNMDPFMRAIPGQSLTDSPGQHAWEKPPRTSSVTDALESMVEGMHEPINEKGLVGIMEVGMSAETIASSMVMRAFSSGTITPDMAELMKPFLIVALIGIAYDNKIENLRVMNNPIDTPIDENKLDEIKERMGLGDDSDFQTEEMPEDFSQFEEGLNEESMSEGFINENAPRGMSEDMPEDMQELGEPDMPEQGFINKEMTEGMV